MAQENEPDDAAEGGLSVDELRAAVGILLDFAAESEQHANSSFGHWKLHVGEPSEGLLPRAHTPMQDQIDRRFAKVVAELNKLEALRLGMREREVLLSHSDKLKECFDAAIEVVGRLGEGQGALEVERTAEVKAVVAPALAEFTSGVLHREVTVAVVEDVLRLVTFARRNNDGVIGAVRAFIDRLVMPEKGVRGARSLVDVANAVSGADTGLHLFVGNRRQRNFRYALACFGYDEGQQELADPMMEAFTQVEAAVMTDEFDGDIVDEGKRRASEPLHIPRPKP